MEIKLGEQIIINLYQTVLYRFDVSLCCDSKDGKLAGDLTLRFKSGAFFVSDFDLKNCQVFKKIVKFQKNCQVFKQKSNSQSKIIRSTFPPTKMRQINRVTRTVWREKRQ